MFPYRKLRIAHFGRYAEGDTDLVRCIFLSLQKMGHIVQEWNTEFYSECLYDPLNSRGGNGPIYIRLTKIYDRLINFQPDLIICNAGGLTFSQKDVKLLNGIPVLGITLSDPDVKPTVSSYANNFTWLTTNSILSYNEYREQGVNHVYYMPLAIDDRFLKERLPVSKYISDVAIIGHGRKDRYPIAKELCKNFKTKLYGKNWPFPKNSMGPVRGEEWFNAAYSTKILVNFPRTVKGYINVKAGVFEAASTGKLLFTGYFDEVNNLFEYDKEIIGYGSKEELVNKINYYLKHPEQAQIIGENAKKRCYNEHIWEHRFNKLFKELNLI